MEQFIVGFPYPVDSTVHPLNNWAQITFESLPEIKAEKISAQKNLAEK